MIIKYTDFTLENNYWTDGYLKIYENYIKILYDRYFRETGLDKITLLDIKTVGSFGTNKFVEGKSDIDFMLYTNKDFSKSDMIPLIDYINTKLIERFGEIENKGGKVEVIGINDIFWF